MMEKQRKHGAFLRNRCSMLNRRPGQGGAGFRRRVAGPVFASRCRFAPCAKMPGPSQGNTIHLFIICLAGGPSSAAARNFPNSSTIAENRALRRKFFSPDRPASHA